MNYKRLAVSLALPQLAGFIGSFFTASSVSTWYVLLQKPVLNPPAWVFGPVWIILYFLMGISVYLVWQKNGPTFLFWIHLIINALWSFVFFGLRNPGWAFINLVVLWLLIVVLIVKFRKVSRWAAWLLIPYLVWVSFAGYLNYSIWRLNAQDVKLCPPQCDFTSCPVELFYYNPEKNQSALMLTKTNCFGIL